METTNKKLLKENKNLQKLLLEAQSLLAEKETIISTLLEQLKLAYFPKSTDFKKVSQSAIEDVIVKLNDRSRKKLNYKTPAKIIAEHMVAIVA